jgi:uncharacterized membrane protein YidH (DUF202 family)
MTGREVPTRMSNVTDERRDNLLGGFTIILIGILISSSAVWGLVDNVYSMNSGPAPIMFIILGIGSIILGISIFIHKPEA